MVDAGGKYVDYPNQGTYSFRKDGDLDRYSFQHVSSDIVVQHVVHDTQAGTISVFQRDPNGRFI